MNLVEDSEERIAVSPRTIDSKENLSSRQAKLPDLYCYERNLSFGAALNNEKECSKETQNGYFSSKRPKFEFSQSPLAKEYMIQPNHQKDNILPSSVSLIKRNIKNLYTYLENTKMLPKDALQYTKHILELLQSELDYIIVRQNHLSNNYEHSLDILKVWKERTSRYKSRYNRLKRELGTLTEELGRVKLERNKLTESVELNSKLENLFSGKSLGENAGLEVVGEDSVKSYNVSGEEKQSQMIDKDDQIKLLKIEVENLKSLVLVEEKSVILERQKGFSTPQKELANAAMIKQSKRTRLTNSKVSASDTVSQTEIRLF